MYSSRLIPILIILMLLTGCLTDFKPTPTAVPPSPTPTAVPPSPTIFSTPTPEPTPTLLPWSPQVVYTSPAPGGELTLDGAVTIRFDQPMDKLSVESAFLFARADSVDEHLEGSFSWPRPDTVMFTPTDLNRQHNYQVRLGSQAFGENKLQLREPLSLNVRPVGFLTVAQVMPVNNSEAEVDTAVTVIFNRAVVPLTPTDRQGELPHPLLFNPPIQGQGEWLSTTIYRFSPAEPLPGGTTYEVEIPAGFAGLTGSPMAETYNWAFRTQAPAVTDISLKKGVPDLAPNGTITVTFNTPMDTASTEAAISFDPAAPGGLSFEWDEDHRVVEVTPQRPLPLETLYALIVETSAQSDNGQAMLAEEYRHNFRSYPFPKVVSAEPRNGELVTEEDLFYGLPNVTFAGPMNPDSFADHIVVQPAPDGLDYTYREFIDYSSGKVGSRLAIYFIHAPSTQYTVTLLAAVADPYGNTLGEDYTIEYSTPTQSPLLHLNLPSNRDVGYLSRSFPSAVDLIYRNISQAEVNLYNAGLPFGLLFDSYHNLPVYAPDTEPLRSWAFTNTAVLNGVTIENILMADGGVLPNGVYFVEATSPEIPEPIRWQDERAVLIVADTNLMIKQTFDTVYVWATDLATGSPTAGRTVTLYDETGQLQGTAVTDADGFASFPFVSPDLNLRRVLVVSNASGQPGYGVAYRDWGNRFFGQHERPYATYFYTDRPIYRPGDTVYFRGIVRDTNYGRYKPTSLTTLPMIVESWLSYQDETIYFQENIALDKNGTLTGQFILPNDAPVGTYRLDVEDFDIAVQISFNSSPGVFFEVAEYRKPEFQVMVSPEKLQALIGEEITAAVTATYYFGGPAANLPVQWATCYGRGHTARNYCGEPEPSGEGLTNSKGQLTIPVPTVLSSDALNDQWVTVMAVVSGVGELPTAGFSTIRLYTAETLAHIKPASYVNRANQDMRLNVTTVDWDDNEAANTPVSVTIVRREWMRKTTGIYHYTTWEPVDTPVTTITVTTDELGYAPVLFVPPEGGSYVATAVATDPNGRSYTATTTFYASDPVTVWGGANSRGLTLKADQDSYAPGDTAHILVQSPFTETVSAWMTIERGVTVEQQIVTLNGTSQILEIPVTAEYAPNVYVTIVAVRGTNGGQQFADAQSGVVNLPVSTEQLELTLTLTPQNTQLSPGDTVTYDIAVTDYLGQPVQANLSLALVDLAVLSLKPDNSPPILDVFYAEQAYRSKLGGGLFISAEGLPIIIPEQGYGGGGGGDDGDFGLSGADSYGLEGEVRRDFPDTAYWQGNLTTDENGQTSVAISLPDSTTTWRLSSKAISLEGTLVGQASTDVVVSKPLLIRPMTPRFFTVGDQITLGATVHNNTAETLSGTARLEADGVSLLTEAEQAIAIAPGDSGIVQWPVRVEDVAFVDLTFLASAGTYSDATKPTFGIAPDQIIPVIHYKTLDVVGSSGVLAEPGKAVEAIFLPETVTDGEMVLQLTPSLAAALLDALESTHLVNGRSACAHELGNQLLANVTVSRALAQLKLEDDALSAQLDSLITADLNRLLALMKADGGWGWCGSADSDPVLTASITLAVLQAQALGYTNFSEAAINQAIMYLDHQILVSPISLKERSAVTRQAFFIYVLAYHKNVIPRLDALFDLHRDSLSPYAKALMVRAYQLNGDDGSHTEALLADLAEEVVISATGAHWEDNNQIWSSLSSDIRGTAMVVEALTHAQADSPLLSQAVRWLMTARTASYWPTPHETAWTMQALTDWLTAAAELQPDYAYSVQLNDTAVTSGSFTLEDSAERVEMTLPLTDLPREVVNFLSFEHGEGNGRLYYAAFLNSLLPAGEATAVDRGITVQRTYYLADCEQDCQPISEIPLGEQIRVELTVIAATNLLYTIIEDPLPAGTEAFDPNLATTASFYQGNIQRTDLEEQYMDGYWGWWYFNQIQYLDEKVRFTAVSLPAGAYQYTYYLQTTMPGTFQVPPATARQEFSPDVFGRSEGMILQIR